MKIIQLSVAARSDLGHLKKVINELGKSKEYDFRFQAASGAYIDKNRNACITAQQGVLNPVPRLDCDAYFFLDTDMITHARQAINICNVFFWNDIDVLGAAYLVNGPTPEPTLCVWKDGSQVLERNASYEIEEVDATGMGATIFSSDIIHKMDFPYFESGYDDDLIHRPEDWVFCHKARWLGFKVFCDFGIRVKHDRRDGPEFRKKFEIPSMKKKARDYGQLRNN